MRNVLAEWTANPPEFTNGLAYLADYDSSRPTTFTPTEQAAAAAAASWVLSWLTVISPGERSEWIEAEHDSLLAGCGEPDPAALAAIHHQYGLEIIGPPPAW